VRVISWFDHEILMQLGDLRPRERAAEPDRVSWDDWPDLAP
jgi:hypothetical protein